MENNNRQGCRPVVKWFAEQMEAALKRNDHKSGWLNDDWDELHDRILDETKELYRECGKFSKDEEKIIKEAADVANFAMMIADKFGKQFGQEQASESPSINRDKPHTEIVKAIVFLNEAGFQVIPNRTAKKWFEELTPIPLTPCGWTEEKPNKPETKLAKEWRQAYESMFDEWEEERKKVYELINKNRHLMVSVKKIKELSDSAKIAPTSWDIDKIIRAIKDITNEHLNT